MSGVDDLSAAINKILSDPQSVQQLQAIAASMGLGGEEPHQQPEPPPYAYAQSPYRPNRGQPRYMQNMNFGRGQNPQQNYHYNHYGQRQNQPENSGGYEAPPSASSGTGASHIDINALSAIIDKLTGNTAPPPPPQNSGGIDLSALSGILSGLQGGGQQNTSGGLDLSALSGLLGNMQASSPQPQQPASGGLDLSALSGILSGLQGGGPQGPPGGVNMSSLAGILSGIQGQGQAQPEQGGNFNLSALTSMLGGPPQSGGSGGGGGMDMSMLMKFQQAMSTMGATSENVRLLMSLKKHLTTERAKKVDDAVRVMQMIQFLPLLKDSGLFGGLEKVFDNFDLGGLGLGNLLGSIMGRR